MADFGDVEAFRAEARKWLEANLPDELKRDPAQQMAAAMGQPEGEAAPQKGGQAAFAGKSPWLAACSRLC